MNSTALHCTATCRITLQHTATYCNTLQHTATCNRVCRCQLYRHDTSHCNTLQHTATHCNTLQHTATHCNKQHGRSKSSILTRSSTVQHTDPATHGNTLQRTATHCNTLQHLTGWVELNYNGDGVYSDGCGPNGDRVSICLHVYILIVWSHLWGDRVRRCLCVHLCLHTCISYFMCLYLHLLSAYT